MSKLTDAQIASACLSYRHDFGLMTREEQEHFMRMAREWERCLDAERSPAERDGWIPVSERLPGSAECCDWLMPMTELKRERWILCAESAFTASVPGNATHWRLARPLPAAPSAEQAGGA